MLREACSRLLLLRRAAVPYLARSAPTASSSAAAASPRTPSWAEPPAGWPPATRTFHLPTPASGHLPLLDGCSKLPPWAFQAASCYSTAPRRGAGARGRRPAPAPRPQRAAAGKVAGPAGDGEGGSGEQQQEQEEVEEVHKYFPLIGGNKVQPFLEESEVERCLWLMPSSLWLRVSESPLQSAWLHWVRRPLREAGRALVKHWITRAADMSTEMVQEAVDQSFDGQEFLEGATAALESTLSLIAPQRQMHSRLQDCVSEQVLTEFSASLTELKEDHGWELQSVTAHVHGAQLMTCNLWSAESVERFDKSWAQQASTSTSRSWLVLTVAANCTMVTTSTAARDPSSSSSTGGSQQPRTRTQRMHKHGNVYFARGPLPQGPQPSLEGLPWRIIGMC